MKLPQWHDGAFLDVHAFRIGVESAMRKRRYNCFRLDPPGYLSIRLWLVPLSTASSEFGYVEPIKNVHV